MPSPMLFLGSSTMEYNYFTEAQPQPYQIFPYSSDALAVPQNVDTSTSTAFTLDGLAAPMLQQGMPQKFDEPLTYDNGLLIMNPNAQSHDSLNMLSHGSMGSIGSIDSALSLDLEAELQGREGSLEERDIVTPAQSRRKAQNRAAQRAFRERKERHVRDLESKLDRLTSTATSLKSDNDRLKVLLQKVQTENELLRASAATSQGIQSVPSLPTTRRTSSQSDISEQISSASTSASSLTAATPAMPQLLSASATWDYLQAHPKYKSGVVDIGKVCEQLKKLVQSHGTGPMFDKDDVRRIIEEVEGNGADEML